MTWKEVLYKKNIIEISNYNFLYLGHWYKVCVNSEKLFGCISKL